jgi:hypothetical protein
MCSFYTDNMNYVSRIEIHWLLKVHVTNQRYNMAFRQFPCRRAKTFIRSRGGCHGIIWALSLAQRGDLLLAPPMRRTLRDLNCFYICRHKICYVPRTKRSRDRVVGITTDYGLDGRGVGVRVPVRSRMFSSPRRPDRFWGPPNFLSNGYRG